MEWLTRPVAIGLIVVAVAWSIGRYNEVVADLATTPPSPAVASDPPALAAPAPVLADDRPPEYLRYTVGFDSGFHTVADVPDSDDRDNKPRRSSRRSEQPDYPVEYDLVPGASLAPQGEVMPGLYATSFDTIDCSYELRRIMKDKTDQVIGGDSLGAGRMLVSINEIEPDSFIATPQCGEWIHWSPLVEPLTVASNGDYWIGDLARGEWLVPAGCVWEKVVAFRGAELADVVESGVGPALLVVDGDTPGVRVRGCERGDSMSVRDIGRSRIEQKNS